MLDPESAPPSMTRDEALELLELPSSATPAEIQRAFESVYAALRTQVTNESDPRREAVLRERLALCETARAAAMQDGRGADYADLPLSEPLDARRGEGGARGGRVRVATGGEPPTDSARAAYLLVRGPVAWTVHLDGEPAGTLGDDGRLRLTTIPGTHEVEVRGPAGECVAETVRTPVGEQAIVQFAPLAPEVKPEPPRRPPPAAEPAPRSSARARRFLLGGTAVAGLALVGVALTRAADDATPSVASDAAAGDPSPTAVAPSAAAAAPVVSAGAVADSVLVQTAQSAAPVQPDADPAQAAALRRRFGNIHAAAYDGSLAGVRAFLSAGVSIDAPEKDLGKTPLMIATEWGHLELARYLVAHGADVHARDGLQTTALQYIGRKGYRDAARLRDYDAIAHAELLRRAGATRLDVVDSRGSTVLHGAVASGNRAFVRWLLAHGHPADPRDSAGVTPLRHAPDTAMVRLLVNAGASVDSRRADGESVLTTQVRGVGFAPKLQVQLLLELGADVDTRDSSGQTALHWAVRQSDSLMTSILLRSGATVNAADRSGVTALHHAAARGREGIIRLLVEHGADVNAKRGDGSTPLSLVREAIAREKQSGTSTSRAYAASAAYLTSQGAR